MGNYFKMIGVIGLIATEKLSSEDIDNLKQLQEEDLEETIHHHL